MNGTIFVFATLDGKCNCRLITECSSGISDPGTSATAYYNTETNTLNYYYATGTKVQASFPIAICTVNNNSITSINHIFNGMGYIGSIVWIDKGVKGLIPNGRNNDGTLNNIEYTTQEIFCYSSSAATSYANIIKFLCPDNLNGFTTLRKNFFSGLDKDKPLIYNSILYYATDTNIYYLINNGIPQKVNIFPLISYEHDGSSIISFTPFQTCSHINKFSDKIWLGSLAMPSSRYTTLTLNITGSYYTAPANGWFAIRKAVGTANTGITFIVYDVTKTFEIYRQTLKNPIETDEIAMIIPVLEGQILQINYDVTGETNYFRFIYAKGETI